MLGSGESKLVKLKDTALVNGVSIDRGVAMCKGGGPWPPQNFELYILAFNPCNARGHFYILKNN